MPDRADPLFEYLLRLGDNSLVLGHRLSEWCGHGPVLEEDIALSNMALDLIGQATMWLDHAATVEGVGRNADELAYKRDVLDWRNTMLVEQPNGDFAVTIARQFLFDCHHHALLSILVNAGDEKVAAIAAKALKEVTYHRRHSGEWLIRLGDGTEESHERAQTALDQLWGYTHELFEADAVDLDMAARDIGVDPADLKPAWDTMIDTMLAEATLRRPANGWSIRGGRQGLHSEHLGYILAEMQFLPRAYPDARW
ncbi:MAG: phenylacetate-CoA oxygenase subunit PaaC [Alphaproteobacteria bacterium]|nr:phenylacetate-CoA oxygenase subunit PaaC [Alphaproteobacteria bacterium]